MTERDKVGLATLDTGLIRDGCSEEVTCELKAIGKSAHAKSQ